MTLVTAPNSLLSFKLSITFHASAILFSKGVCFLSYTILAVKLELNHFLMLIEDWFLMTNTADTCM